KVTLTANPKEVRKTTLSMHGQSTELIPLYQGVSLRTESQRTLFWLVATIFSVTIGVAIGLLTASEPGFVQPLLNGLAWLAAGVFYLYCFYRSHTFQISVHGALRTGVSFRPSIIEGRMIQFPEVAEATEALLECIQESRRLSQGPAFPGGTGPVPPANVPPSHYPPSPQYDLDEQETINEPPHHSKPPAPRTNTGTVEYGDDQPAFETSPPGWDGGVEPGTSDSIQFRQSITRSSTGMCLNVPSNYDGDEADYDPGPADSGPQPPSSGNNTHRGTVSWEEHADKTQDEMQAEAELNELKRSRPKRGEAKQRLRELMRRFPQTEAAIKARRMLERLESGQ
ncbi:MAG: hypothetical protein KDA84_28015, partial [Planctomycetaceae bacterium]|nr:hypothetical protein [Planctomycetaceae bacterium]